MGSYAWSGNALPIPVIRFGLSQFTNVPMTRGWVAVQGFYADGLFENNRPNTSELKLHQKSLYIRLGTTQSRVRLYGGFNHQVQWGGKSRYNTVDGQMPTGFKNYIYAVTGMKPFNANPNMDFFDYTNRVGNHLGTVDAAIEWIGKKYSLFLYRQNIYDDGSLFHLNNIMDGLNGIRLRIKNNESRAVTVHEVVAELLYTKSQGGTEFGYIRSKQGRDNYFNNSQVWDGWSYYNRTIGTPFIPPSTETAPLWPSYKFTSNNRVAVVHLGLKGTLLYNYIWSTRFSYSSNSGTYDVPFDTHPRQFSGMLTLQRRTSWLGGNTILTGTVATDIGNLYKNSTGLMLSIRKEGLFNN
ncbi:hypothetical protein GCM10027291_02050 [Telluribacter humicola]